MSDLKYLIAYIVPLFCRLGVMNGGVWPFITPTVIIVLVPLIELIIPPLQSNLGDNVKESKLKNRFFDVILRLNVPIINVALFYGLYTFSVSS
jgi:alkane 1-monooxygenase